MKVQIATCVKKALSPQWSASSDSWTGPDLEKVQSYKYLEVLINSDLTWSDHISRVCSKAKQQLDLCMLYRQFYGDSNTTTLRALYITQLSVSTPGVRNPCLGPTSIKGH